MLVLCVVQETPAAAVPPTQVHFLCVHTPDVAATFVIHSKTGLMDQSVHDVVPPLQNLRVSGFPTSRYDVVVGYHFLQYVNLFILALLDASGSVFHTLSSVSKC